MSERPKLRVGISVGDTNGIGLEVILKTLSDNRVLKFCTPVIFASGRLINQYRKTLELPEFALNTSRDAERLNHKQVNAISPWEEDPQLQLGKPTPESGQAAVQSLLTGCDALERGDIDALVTGPLDKSNSKSDRFPHEGHTEFLTQRFQVRNSAMFMVSADTRIAVVTHHIPLKDVASSITEELIFTRIRVLHRSLINDFGIAKPRIAVLGLNPHASDNGLFGTEEKDLILPAIEAAQQKKGLVYGPYAADGFFGSGAYKSFDAILAMYHDQGLIPFKTLSFGNGVNFTAGLPVVRTSPDHGTGFEIAGRGEANPDSFRAALFQAVDIARNRAAYGIPEPV